MTVFSFGHGYFLLDTQLPQGLHLFFATVVHFPRFAYVNRPAHYEKGRDLLTPHDGHWYALTGTLWGTPDVGVPRCVSCKRNYQFRRGQQPKPQFCCYIISITSIFSGHSDGTMIHGSMQAAIFDTFLAWIFPRRDTKTLFPSTL
jgi:hypothetical protein